MSKKKALFYNLLSSSATIPSAIISYFILDVFQTTVPIFLAISAASFLYIALSDLTPQLHQKTESKEILKQIILVALGIFVMVLVIILGGHNH
jgi:zinc and cadmium transporter